MKLWDMSWEVKDSLLNVLIALVEGAAKGSRKFILFIYHLPSLFCACVLLPSLFCALYPFTVHEDSTIDVLLVFKPSISNTGCTLLKQTASKLQLRIPAPIIRYFRL